VHENFTAQQAYDHYLNLIGLKSTVRKGTSRKT